MVKIDPIYEKQDEKITKRCRAMSENWPQI